MPLHAHSRSHCCTERTKSVQYGFHTCHWRINLLGIISMWRTNFVPVSNAIIEDEHCCWDGVPNFTINSGRTKKKRRLEMKSHKHYRGKIHVNLMRQMLNQSGVVVNFSCYSTFEPFPVVLTKFYSYEWNINLFRKFIGGLRMSAVYSVHPRCDCIQRSSHSWRNFFFLFLSSHLIRCRMNLSHL